MNIVFWRVLGNDICPRHQCGQTIKNTQFIIDNENVFDGCTKKFLLNRIADPQVVVTLREILKDYEVHEIPFDPDEYRAIGVSKRRILYFTNQNVARNYCLDNSDGADFILPFDGGIFMRDDGWESLITTFALNPDAAFWAVPLARVVTYDAILRNSPPLVKEEFKIGRKLFDMSEPQIVFTPKSDLRFNVDLTYGKVNKVELIWKLGIPGVWDRWEPKIRTESLQNVSEYFRKVKYAGFVFRMPSGNDEADVNKLIRYKARIEGISRFRNSLDAKFLHRH